MQIKNLLLLPLALLIPQIIFADMIVVAFKPGIRNWMLALVIIIESLIFLFWIIKFKPEYKLNLINIPAIIGIFAFANIITTGIGLFSPGYSPLLEITEAWKKGVMLGNNILEDIAVSAIAMGFPFCISSFVEFGIYSIFFKIFGNLLGIKLRADELFKISLICNLTSYIILIILLFVFTLTWYPPKTNRMIPSNIGD